MLKPILLLLFLANGPTSTMRVDVNVTPSVNAPPPVTPPSPAKPGKAGTPGPASVLSGEAAGVGTAIALPKGHTLRACTPNLPPEQSAWKSLLEQADGQLCNVTKVAS